MKKLILLFLFYFLSFEIYSANKADTIFQTKVDSVSFYSLQKTKTEVLKLKEEINSLRKNNSRNFLKYLSENSSALTVLVALAGAIFTFLKFSKEQKDQKQTESKQQERDLELKIKEKNIRLEENFSSIVKNLGSNNPSLKASAAISLISYCKDDRKAFHEQVLLICIANLKLDLDETTNRLLVNSLENAIKANLKEKSLKQLNVKLTRLKLDTIDLSGLNLEDIDLAFSSLKFANLSNTKLKRMRGYKTNFFGANLTGANLQEARLQKAIFEKSKMHETNLISADLKYSNLKYCKFHAAQMQSAHFQSAELIGAEFNKADIADAYFLNLTSDVKTKIQKAKRWEKANYG
ncbi:MAG: pentapeptide repeat-containing protein [Mariniphaga sp.]|nr:pentapeptide repeat-containing protein [Mariniphaga sp.]